MSIGKQTGSEKLASRNPADVEEKIYPRYPVFSMLNKNFEVLDLEDNELPVEGKIGRKSLLSETD